VISSSGVSAKLAHGTIETARRYVKVVGERRRSMPPQTRGPQSQSLPESLSKTLPAVLRRVEVLYFLGPVEDIEHQAILTTCYAAGLHISEAVRLKTSWLDNQRVVIRAAQGSLIVESSAHYLALLTSSHRPSPEIAYHRRC